MVNNNTNLPPIEEIREIKNEIPSFEEFLKNYEVDERIINSYNFEVDSYKDISVGKLSGPMPFNDALMIAGSQTILDKVRRDFPKVAELLEWNPNLTLGFLQEKSALSLYRGTDAFRVPCSHRDDYSKTGPEAWQEYRRKIKEYVDNISSKGKAAAHHEELTAAREVMVGYIHEEYYKVLPRWPDVGKTNTRSFEANVSGAYNYGATSQVVWSCIGWIEVTDERPASDIFKASFKGSPEIKLLILNLHQLKTIEDMCVSRGIEDAKNHIKNKQPTYQLTWNDL